MQDGIRDVRRFFQTYELCRIIRGRAPRGAGNPSPASELVLGVKREDATARFCAGAFPMDFLAGYPVLPIREGILSRLQRSLRYGQYTAREECEKRAGEYRENEGGEDRDPLQ